MAILEQPPVPGNRSGVLERIHAALPALPPSERRVAERILADPGQAIALSISEFAALCNVAQSTVSRLCNSVGVSSYAALRLGLSNDFAVKPSASEHEAVPSSAEAGVSTLAKLIGMLRDTSDLLLAARALRTSTHVEIWAAADLALVGIQLADQLTAITIPAAIAPIQARWATRAAGLPPETIVIVLAATIDDLTFASMTSARKAGARILCCTVRPARRVMQASDWLVPLPADPTPDFVGMALLGVLTDAVQAELEIAGPPGPASPWRAWPHTRSVFLPTPGDPIPAILLMREDPPRPRPLVLYFSGMEWAKESALLGIQNNPNFVCPKIVAPLLNAGYHVLLVDAQAHGARKRAWESTGVLLHESLSGKGRDVLADARIEATYLVDGARALGVTGDGAARMPIAAVGQSWGGLQVLLTMAGDARISCGVGIMPVIHIPHLQGMEDLVQVPRILHGAPGAWMGSYLAPRPLLLITGEKDASAPPQYTQAFTASILPAYTNLEASERLECVVLPDLIHNFDVRQVEAMLAWLDRYLPSSFPDENGAERRRDQWQ